ncbi:kinetochore-associated Ndc80 complex subunit nuf2 [Thecaphora frezii]
MPPPPSSSSAGDNYSSFPAIKTEELVAVLNEMGLSIGAEDIVKPQGHVAHRVFIAFLECLSGTSQEAMERTRHSTLAQTEYKEMYEDGLQFLMLFREVRQMMAAATITDFHLQDMTRPNPKRFKRQMSALVNFYRFRSDRINEFDELVANSEDLEAKRIELEDEIDRHRSDLDRIKLQRQMDEPKVKALKDSNAQITDQLLQARKVQKKLIEEVDILKSEREQLIAKQQGLMEEKLRISEKLTYLKARVVSSPKKMKSNVTELVEKVNQDTMSLGESEKKARDYEERLEVLTNLDADLEACLVAMEQVNAELLRTSGEERDYEDTLALCETRKHELEQLDHQLEQTVRKVRLAVEKNERARNLLESKVQLHQQKMEALAEELEKAKAQKAERLALADAKLSEGDQIENKINELRVMYEDYYSRMHRQKEAIEKAVTVYINTLTKSLDLDRFEDAAALQT